MDTINISDTGSGSLVSGLDLEAVQAALDGMVVRGASVVSSAARFGTKWVASCTRPASEPAEQRDADIDAVIRDAVWAPVKIEDAGANLIVNGAEKGAVERALALLAANGGGTPSPVAPFGNGWVGSCPNPAAEAQTEIERVGLQLIVSGPSEAAVQAKFRELQSGGAVVTSAAQRLGGKYVMLCEVPPR